MLARARRILKPRAAPQALVPYRVAVATAVLISIGAVVAQGAVAGSVGLLAAAAVPAGFVVSYRGRHRKNVALKLALAAALFLAFGAFLGAVRGAASVDDTRAPLATLFMWVLVLHSFDVPRRRDLAFSVGSSVALIALAGSLAFSTGFIAWVAPYAIALAAAVALGHEAKLRESADGAVAEVMTSRAGTPRSRGVVRPLLGIGAVTLVCAFAVFIVMPRVPGIRVAQLPLSLGAASPIAGFTGGVINPGRRGDVSGGTATTAFSPDAYFGYGERLDLRVRGRLSDELVMRVRSPEPHLWRAQAYDRYDGAGWTSSDSDLQTLRAGWDQSIAVPSPREGRSAFAHEVVQTFYVERELPNLLFHAADAQEVYAPATSAELDDFNSIRLPFTLEKDTIYSVVSQVPDVTVEDLRGTAPGPTDGLERYLELPPTLSERFYALAEEITGPHVSQVDKVLAVQEWLRENKEYRLDISRDPPGTDPVEVFLFERKEGFCEQIATSMALLLRAAGVPTRLVTGFGEGQRNLFTGYWEVRNSDAHAWVEVLYPEFGWLPYDPTFGVPQSDAANTTFMFAPLARIAGGVVPVDALRGMAGTVTDAAGPAGTAGILAALVLGLAGVVMRLRRPRRRMDTAEERSLGAWLRVEDALRRRGYRREPHETVREFAARARSCEGLDEHAFDELVARFSRTRYGGSTATPEDAAACEELSAHVTEELRRTRPAPFPVRR